VVYTFANREGRHRTALQDAAEHAQLAMLDLAALDKPDPKSWLRGEMQRVSDLAAAFDDEAWTVREARVEGSVTPFHYRDQDRSWAAVAYLESSAVGLSGWEVEFDEWPLTTVDPFAYPRLQPDE
jgi:hypothetical protein